MEKLEVRHFPPSLLLNRLYEKRADLPAEFGKQFSRQISQFIGKAMEIHKFTKPGTNNPLQAP